MTSLLKLLSFATGFIKVRYLVDKEVIDNVVFRCHYRVTSVVLFICCILCTAYSLIGNPVYCLSGSEFEGRENLINTYCWITATFTLPHQQTKPVGTHVIAPGVGTYIPKLHDTVYHKYYQWVPFVLLLQGIMFFFPHWLWKNWEGGKIKEMSEGLRGSMVHCKENNDDCENFLVKYFIHSKSQYKVYGICYLFCEVLNFVNVVGNIFFVDKFLGNTFLMYGTKVIQNLQLQQENRTDPMVAIFPRMTKCSLNLFGSGGSVTNKDFLCVLPLNILNEKVYIFLWFWFIILSILSGLALLYSTVLTIYPYMRRIVLQKRFKFKDQVGVATLIEETQYGDFLLLHLLGQNMCSRTFCNFLEKLSSTLNNNNFSSPPGTEKISTGICPSKDKFLKDV